MAKRVMRAIVSVSYYRSHCKVGHGTARIVLECGHTICMKKSSLGLHQRKAHCSWCERGEPCPKN